MKNLKRVLVVLSVPLFIYLLSNCKKSENTEPVIFTTSKVIYLNDFNYQLWGSIVKLGTLQILEHGFCWSNEEMPTINDSTIYLGPTNTIGEFSSTLIGLNTNATYYVRSFVTTNEGTEYARELTLQTLPITQLTDYDGNIYSAVKIGDQTWMTENLKVTHFADGRPIQNVTNSDEWLELNYSGKGDAYCWYNNDDSLGTIYGALYTWPAIIDREVPLGEDSIVGSDENPSGIQGVCPDGWHVPSDNEWIELLYTLNPEYDESKAYGTFVSYKLKSAVNGIWDTAGGQLPTNETGFSGIPGGERHGGLFYDLGVSAYFATTSEYHEQGPLYFVRRQLHQNLGQVVIVKGFKNIDACSVRCVKD